jgi:exopolyphosphatase/guanosine-5'-triphosphate,3'-diphosphate pyrophosphatase
MRIAAIDLGTNSFHLLIVEARPDGSFVPLVREKEMLRLGGDVTRDGRISREAARRATQTLRRFRSLADNAGATQVVACATSAFREAANGLRLATAIHDETGISVRIIDGQEEAGLIYSAIRSSVLMARGPVLAFDLGGGSLEVMVGDGSDLWWATSLPLGVARLSAELVRNDPPSGGDRRRLRRRLVELLGPVAADVATRYGAAPPEGPALAVGSGGTFCDLARMLAYRRTGTMPVSVNQLTFRRHEFLELHQHLFESTAAERRRLPGLEPRRAELVPAGSMVLATAMELFGFDQFTVSEWALREGIVLDAIRRDRLYAEDGGDIRRSSVVALARRCNWDEPHCRHVAHLAGELFDETRRLHRLGPRERELLESAALLHDIGEHVSVLAQHKHTSYLIQHGRLRGFSPEEVSALAALARYGGRGEPKSSHKPFGSLDGKTRERVVKLAALLRLAASLDRGRAQSVETVEVEQQGARLRLRVRSLANPELEVWAAQRQSGLFERAFGRRLEVLASGGGRRPCGAMGTASRGSEGPVDGAILEAEALSVREAARAAG